MTTVAWDGNTLAADKQVTVGNLIRSFSKIRKLSNGDILAFTGEIGPGMIMMKWYEDGADLANYPECQKDKDDWCRLIVATAAGEILEFESYPAVLRFDAGRMAWGTGKDFALGALSMGAKAHYAIQIASQFDIQTGCGVESYEVIPQ